MLSCNTTHTKKGDVVMQITSHKGCVIMQFQDKINQKINQENYKKNSKNLKKRTI